MFYYLVVLDVNFLTQNAIGVVDLFTRLNPSNKIFIISLERYNRETEEKKNKINSIIKFEFVESIKSKKIDQNNADLILELQAIDILKKNFKYEIVMLFSNNKPPPNGSVDPLSVIVSRPSVFRL